MSNLAHEIYRFHCDHGVPLSTIGRLSVKDPRLYTDLVRGRQLRPATEERVRTWMREYIETKEKDDV